MRISSALPTAAKGLGEKHWGILIITFLFAILPCFFLAFLLNFMDVPAEPLLSPWLPVLQMQMHRHCEYDKTNQPSRCRQHDGAASKHTLASVDFPQLILTVGKKKKNIVFFFLINQANSGGCETTRNIRAPLVHWSMDTHSHTTHALTHAHTAILIRFAYFN